MPGQVIPFPAHRLPAGYPHSHDSSARVVVSVPAVIPDVDNSGRNEARNEGRNEEEPEWIRAERRLAIDRERVRTMLDGDLVTLGVDQRERILERAEWVQIAWTLAEVERMRQDGRHGHVRSWPGIFVRLLERRCGMSLVR